MTMVKRLTISRGGQISVPASVRKRWATSTVMAEDLGDHLVLRPSPDDPIEAAIELLAPHLQGGPAAGEERDEYRREELAAEEGKWRRHYGRADGTEGRG